MTFNDYQLVRQIGQGGFGKVYQARNLKGVEVAIKELNKNEIKAKNMTKRVEQEIILHKSCDHPNIVSFIDWFKEPDFVYIIMEFCDNGDLKRYVDANGPLSEEEVRFITKQIVDGVVYLHRNNVMHRDLSLSNILMTKHGEVKIADFGLATELKRANDVHRTMCGTPNSISPQVAANSFYGLETDVWSIGCIVYAMLVGKLPFDAPSVKNTLEKVMTTEAYIPSHLSYQAQDLLRKMLEKDPSKRITASEILTHDFITARSSGMNWNDSGVHSMSSQHKPRIIQGGDQAQICRLRDRVRLGSSSSGPLPPSGPIHPPLPMNNPFSSRPSSNPEISHAKTSTLSFGGSSVLDGQERPPPLNTSRLRPSSQTFRSDKACFRASIDSDEMVRIEIMRVGTDIVVEEMIVSADGMNVQVERKSDGAKQMFHYDTLPKKYFKKYGCALRFVNIVRSKTPKITEYTKKARVILMEDSTTCEAFFYDGSRIKSSASGETITPAGMDNGGQMSVEDLQHFRSFHEKLKSMERIQSAIPGLNFPLVYGMKPKKMNTSTETAPVMTFCSTMPTATPQHGFVTRDTQRDGYRDTLRDVFVTRDTSREGLAARDWSRESYVSLSRDNSRDGIATRARPFRSSGTSMERLVNNGDIKVVNFKTRGDSTLYYFSDQTQLEVLGSSGKARRYNYYHNGLVWRGPEDGKALPLEVGEKALVASQFVDRIAHKAT